MNLYLEKTNLIVETYAEYGVGVLPLRGRTPSPPNANNHLQAVVNDIYYVELMSIESEEKDLNRGRFRKFSKQILNPSMVSIYETIEVEARDVINWIGENIEDFWTLRYCLDDDSNGSLFKMNFAFKSEAEAMHFALKWK